LGYERNKEAEEGGYNQYLNKETRERRRREET
jgi:hypothetical protein